MSADRPRLCVFIRSRCYNATFSYFFFFPFHSVRQQSGSRLLKNFPFIHLQLYLIETALNSIYSADVICSAIVGLPSTNFPDGTTDDLSSQESQISNKIFNYYSTFVGVASYTRQTKSIKASALQRCKVILRFYSASEASFSRHFVESFGKTATSIRSLYYSGFRYPRDREILYQQWLIYPQLP